jgi:hypothetical protein
MPDEHPPTSRQADQLRTDVANVESGLEVIMEQVARLPTRTELWRAVLMGMLGGSAVTTVLGLFFLYHLKTAALCGGSICRSWVGTR